MGAVEDFFWTLALLVDLMTKVLRHVVFYKLHTHTHIYILILVVQKEILQNMIFSQYYYYYYFKVMDITKI